MKIIFLDIDGVLNFYGCEWMWDCKNKKRYKVEGPGEGGIYGIDPGKVDFILEIIERTGAKLVLSSTWRRDEDWIGTMEENGLSKNLFLGKTPDFLYKSSLDTFYSRGHEIQDWLDKNSGIERYAIIDDDIDMLPEQKENFFKTNMKYGLEREHVELIVKHLNRKIT